MKRCKHKNGSIIGIVATELYFNFEEGKLESDYQRAGDFLFFYFECNDCGMKTKHYTNPKDKSIPKQLQKHIKEREE